MEGYISVLLLSHSPAQVGRQAKHLTRDGIMVANVAITRFCRLIVLVTNRIVVRDLEVSVPPHFMSFRRASFWTCTKKHLYTILLSFSGRIGFGDGVEMELNLDGQTWWCFKLPWW